MLTSGVAPAAGAVAGPDIAGLPLIQAGEAIGGAGTALAATLVHPIIGAELAAPVREMSKDELLDALNLPDAARPRFEESIDALLSGLGLEPGAVVARNEICVSTTSLYADSMTGVCAACDTHVAEMQRLEREKLALEVEKLRRELEKGGKEDH